MTEAPQFKPHGQFNLRVEGRIVISEITGPWNKELVQQWASAAGPVAQSMAQDGGLHVGIAVVHNSLLCTPDAMDELGRNVRHSTRKLGNIGHLVVADASVEGRDYIEPVYARIYDPGIAHKFFYTLDEARAFALELLAARGY